MQHWKIGSSEWTAVILVNWLQVEHTIDGVEGEFWKRSEQLCLLGR